MLNAASTAEKLGIKVNEIKSSEEKDYKNCIEMSLATDKCTINTLGTILGKNDQRIMRLYDYELDFVPEGNVLICGNQDRPGIIGNIGTVLGKKGINIAHMTWAKKSPAGEAIVVLNTDDVLDNKTRDEVLAINGIEWAAFIVL